MKKLSVFLLALVVSSTFVMSKHGPQHHPKKPKPGHGYSSEGTPQPDTGCMAFFDNENNPRTTSVVVDYMSNKRQKMAGDMTPPPAPVDQLDKDILKVCGAWGNSVSEAAIDALFTAHPEIYIPFEKALAAKGITNAKEYFTKVWYNHKAFEHIFCGQPKGSKIGGLHFRARYLELQLRKEICMMPNNKSEELLPGKVFTMGVRSALGNDAKKGYAITQSAMDIFTQATAGYVKYCEDPSMVAALKSPMNGYVACNLQFKDKTYYMQYVCNPGEGIVTMYPYAGLPQGKPICP